MSKPSNAEIQHQMTPVIRELEKKGINWSKMKNDILKEKMKSTGNDRKMVTSFIV